MNPQVHNFEDIQGRLLKLEKQNRRFKQLGVAALIVPALLLLMGQAPSKKTVEANEFVLRDDGGNIRARLFMTPKIGPDRPEAMLALYDDKGRPSTSLSDTALAFPKFNSSFGADLHFFRPVSGGGVTVGPSGVSILGPQGAETRLGSTDIHILDEGFLTVLTREGVGVTDPQGFEATLGVADLVTPRTGENSKTSAASLLLFDKNKNVIWKAP